jgi:ribosomal protein S18 acetylase RimI-like enzyme
VRTAHGDYWQAEGRLRRRTGGGATRVRGGRLMYSGLGVAYWNAADMVGADFDVEAARRWYASRGCEWGLHVPLGVSFEHGSWVRHKRCMGLEPSDLVPAASAVGLVVQRAHQADVDAFADLDKGIFGGPADLTRAWLRPMFEPAARDWSHWVAVTAEGELVGIATARWTNLEAGPSGTLSGIGVLETWRGRGVGARLTSEASAWLFERGATLVHLNPDNDTAARVYARVGFREVPGFDIYHMQ